MDILMILLIVLVVIVVAALAFAMIRKKQRGGSVLASPTGSRHDGGSS